MYSGHPMGTKIRQRHTKSPLKNKPLRTPGQSLEDQLDEVLMEKTFLWVLLPIFFALMSVPELLRKLLGVELGPLPFLSLAVASVPVIWWRIRRSLPQIRQMRQGIEGEQVVGQSLERLRVTGYEVFHDIPGDGHNIDHVLVGPGGVFAIETKTISKPAGDQRVFFDGECVTVAGFKPDRNPIGQVRAAAKEVSDIIRERAGLEISVKPVVLYPGWFTQSSGKSDVWVLNENAFPKWLDNEDERLTDSQIRQISSGIARHVWDGE